MENSVADHSIVPLTFPGSGEDIRVVWIEEQPWWVVNDVCRELGIVDASDAANRLFDDYRGTTRVADGRGQMRNTNIVNEPGLYQLVFMSRKSNAEAFRRWIFEKVIPAIRQTGSYENAEARKSKVLEALEAGDAEYRRIENARYNNEIPSWVAQSFANANGLLTQMMQFPAVLTTSGEIDDKNGVGYNKKLRLSNGQQRSAMYKKKTGRLPFKAPMKRRGKFRIVNCFLEEDVKPIVGFHKLDVKAIER